MRPIKLTLEGFTSFRKRQELDFSTLDLFAITGPTGAGKSSLLDAITFALYGKVARLGKNTGTELVSQGTTELKVEFQFAVQQTEYKAIRTWQQRAKTAKTDFLLDKLQKGSWERCDRTQNIEDILRMNFDTFIRVILLPQGKFDEFLKGEPRKRRELLRQLAGFEIFEQMRQEASQRAKRYKAEREGTEQVLADLQVPKQQEIIENKQKLETLAQNLPQLQTNAANAQRVLDEEERLFEQIKRLSGWQANLATLNQQSDDMALLEQRLQQAQKVDRLAGEWALTKAARARYDEAQQTVEMALENLNDAQQQLQRHRSNIMDYMGQQLKTADFRAKAALEQVTEAEQMLAQTTPGGTRLEQLKQISTSLIQWQEQQKQVQQARQKWQQATEQLQAAHDEYNNAVAALEKAQTTLQDAQTQNEAVMQQNQAATLRLSLHSGDTCPVCGGVYPSAHQLPLLPEMALVDLKPLQEHKAEAKQALQLAQTAKTRAETTLENLQDLPDKEAELAKRQQHISDVLQTNDWEAEALKQEYQALQEQDEKHHEALKQKEHAEAELKKAEMAQRFAQESYNETLSQDQDSADELERQQHQLQQAESALYQQTEGLSYEELSQSLEQYEENLATKINKANKSYQLAHNHFIQAEETEKNARREIEFASDEKEQRHASWKEALQTVGFTEDDFLKAKASPEQQTEWETTLRHYRDNKIELETHIKAVISAIGKKTTDENTIQQLRQAKITAENQLKQANEQRVELSTWLQRAEEQQQQEKQHSTKLTTLKAQEEIYQILTLNLKSDKFQAYLLEDLEEELVTRATVLLQTLTDSRYILKRKPKNGEYWVEDNWNGGEMRRVRTLSGGETFATSLAMALALSEKLSMGIELGSLFLDEGFGTLDAETLESVTQILESLRQQDRLIGVITHIPALAERLPTQVKVHKSPQGSRLEVET
jgi:DNA repair protein SbcC/Rad50